MTPFSVIYDRFMGKISDPDLLSMFEDDMSTLLENYLIVAIVQFRQCKKGQDIDFMEKRFNESLSIEEIEIYASYMVVEWLSPMINNIQSLKPLMVTRDYQSYSQANHLSKMVDLRRDAEAKANRLMVQYSYYTNGNSYFGGDK